MTNECPDCGAETNTANGYHPNPHDCVRFLTARAEAVERERDAWRTALRCLTFTEGPDDPREAATHAAEYVASRIAIAVQNGRHAAAWKALAKALHADQIHTVEDRAGGARWRVAVSRSAQVAARLAAAEADVAVVRKWGEARRAQVAAQESKRLIGVAWVEKRATDEAWDAMVEKRNAVEALADRLAGAK